MLFLLCQQFSNLVNYFLKEYVLLKISIILSVIPLKETV